LKFKIGDLAKGVTIMDAELAKKEQERLAILENAEMDKEAKQKLLAEKDAIIDEIKKTIQGVKCLDADIPDDLLRMLGLFPENN